MLLLLLSGSLLPLQSYAQLVQAEYFWDSDPGEGSGTAMAASDGNFDEIIEQVMQSGINLPAIGSHSFNIRVQGNDGVWSPVFTTLISIENAPVAVNRTIEVTTAEYFWDADPGEGSGVAMLAFDGDFDNAIEQVMQSGISLPSLGAHSFNMRVKGSDGVWSPVFTTSISVETAPISINRTIEVTTAEYFWDTDPGEGSGVAMLAFDGNFDNALEQVMQSGISLPSLGSHSFNIRVKGSDGVWSPLFTTAISVENAPISINRVINVTMAEYFWDTDPGKGSGIAMLAFDGNFDNALEQVMQSGISLPVLGSHSFNIRVKGSDGVWSPLFTTAISVENAPVSINRVIKVTMAEYFWDSDPGEGSGVAMLAFDGNFDNAIEQVMQAGINLPALGSHTFNIRVKGSDGVWSPIFTTAISVENAPISINRVIKVTMAEYFWDADPGEGSGVAMLAFDGNFDSAIEQVMQSGVSLPVQGSHTFNMRVKGSDGVWSPLFTTAISVEIGPVSINRVIKVTMAEYFWDTDPGEGSGVVLLALDGNLDSAIEEVFKTGISVPASGLHTFNVRVKGSDGVWSPLFTTLVSVEAIPGTPVSDFTADQTTINAGGSVNFTDLSTETPTSWSWNFGDGGTSTFENPSHTYSAAGTYTVSLVATNSTGSAIETKIDYITVNSTLAPVTNFTANQTTINVGGSVSFTDLSTELPTSWSWNFGDGGTSTLENPSHTYSTAGTYTVTLVATNGIGSDSETKTNYIVVNSTVAPVANFTANQTTITAGGSVTFTDLSSEVPTSWSWNFGDGGTSTLENPSHTYNTAGTYTVSLVATNAAGNDSETKVDYITVDTVVLAPVADFTANQTTINVGGSVNFTDLSTGLPTSWSWSFGDGAASTSENPSHTYITAGTYTVSLVATNATGNDSETKVNYITVNSTVAPTTNFTANQTTINVGGSVSFTDLSTEVPTSWSWNFGDGGTSTLENPSHTYSTAGSYTVSLVATNAAGNDSETKLSYITVNSTVGPVTNFTANQTTINVGGSVNFTDLSTQTPTSWSWNFGDGGTSTLENPSHTYNTAGTYTVSLVATNAAGNDSETKIDYITVNSIVGPTANFTANQTTIAVGGSVTFTDLSSEVPTSWSWNFGDGGVSTLENPSHTYSTAGTYTVSLVVTNAAGNDSETKVSYIIVNPPVAPVSNFIANQTTITAGGSVMFTDLSSEVPTSWSWSFGDGGVSTLENPSHTYSTAGTYTVSLVATNAVGNDSETKVNYITVNSLVAPISDFTANQTTITEGGTVNFTDLSTEVPTSWSWNFGDGGVSTLENPSHTYSTAGTYTVSLVATNAAGNDSETKINYITVNSAGAAPVSNFIAGQTTITAGSSVAFTDLSTNTPTSWSWNFGDGGTSTLENPSHTYNTAGTYTVFLVSTNAFGSDNETKINYITVNPAGTAPVSNFIAGQTTVVEGASVAFTDLSTNTPTSWSWNFGDGGTSTLENPSHTYTTAGTYTVFLVSTNAFGSDNETKVNYITVNPAGSAPVTDFIAGQTTITKAGSVAFTDLSTESPTSWSWSFGDGGTSSQENPSHIYTTDGIYTVSLVSTNAFGSDSETKTNYIIVENTVGIANEELSPVCKLYPNPNNGTFTLSFPVEKEGSIVVYDLAGRSVWSKEVSGNDHLFVETISLPEVPNGVYVMKIVTMGKVFIREITMVR